MSNAIFMQMLDSSYHLAYKIGGLALSELLIGIEAIKKFTSLAVLHNDVHVNIIDEALIKFDNVRVVHLL